MTLANEIRLLDDIRVLKDNTLAGVARLLFDPSLTSLAREYAENRGKRVVDVGLNLFVLISDLYHRENFHSDVLKIMLDPSSPHKEGDKYLALFLEFLNASSKNLCIDPANYADASVFREQGRVDLIILGGGPNKHAIIIENKMNDASDMHRQIPRYLDYVKELGCVCDAIVYLRLSTARHPDLTDWTPEEQEEIHSKFVCITAYDDSETDLLHGWINKCERIPAHVDAQLILRQYGTLLQKLGGEIMNKPIMKKFFALMQNTENFKAAESFASMWENLVLYRVEALIDIFSGDVAPFRKVANWNDGDTYFRGLMWRGAHLGIDVEVEPDGYTLSLWYRNDREGSKKMVKAAMKEIGCESKYPVTNGSYKKKFTFPAQHDQLIDFLKALKQDLKPLASRKV